MRERIPFARCANVLEAASDRVHGLRQHSLLVPVRPDEFDEARLVNPARQNPIVARHPKPILRKRGFDNARDVGPAAARSQVFVQFGPSHIEAHVGPHTVFDSKSLL